MDIFETPKWVKPGQYFYKYVLHRGRKIFIFQLNADGTTTTIKSMPIVYENEIKEEVRKLNGWAK